MLNVHCNFYGSISNDGTEQIGDLVKCHGRNSCPSIPANIPNISPTHVKLNVRVVNFPFWPHASVSDGWNAMGLKLRKAGVKRLEVNRNIYSGHFSPQILAQFCQKFWAKSRRVVHCAYVCNWADRSWVAVPLWSSPFICQISGPP